METRIYIESVMLIFQNGKRHNKAVKNQQPIENIETYRSEIKGRFADRKNKLSNVFLTYTER